MYSQRMEELRRYASGADIRNEVDCDELEETMRSTSGVVGNAPAVEEYSEDDSYVEKSPRANTSGNHNAVDTVGKYFEDDLDIEKSRMANSSGNHAVDTVGKYFEDELFMEKSRIANSSGNHATTGGSRGGNAPALAKFEDNLLTKKRQMENPSYISYLEEHPSSKENPSYISYLDKNPPSKEGPSYVSYLEESPPSNRLLAVDLEPMPMPAPPSIGVVPQHRPGAYSYNAEASGANLQRLDQPRFSQIGLEHPNDDEDDNNVRNLNDHDVDVQSEDGGTTEAEVPTNAILPRPSNTDLAVATAIENYSSVLLMEAQELDSEVLQRQEISESKRKRCRMVGHTIVLICSIILGLSLGLSFGRTEVGPSTSQPTMAPTPSPTRPLPPMENLELLYDELPEQTKERLYESNSFQYQAWEWLHKHPNITFYPEWRKKQIFAMATFFFSFEGPNWPKGSPAGSRWMSVNISECTWVMTEAEIAFFAYEAMKLFGPDAYDYHQDFRPCNEEGELQMLGINQLFLSPDLKPMVPPEIGLLTSMKLFGVLMALLLTVSKHTAPNV